MIYLDKQLQEAIQGIEFQIEYLSEDEDIQKDIEDEDPIIEAFQKDRIKQKIEFYKEAKEIFEKALKLHGKAIKLKENVSVYRERNNLIREAMILDLKADIMEIYYNKKDVDIKEEFENFKKNLK